MLAPILHTALRQHRIPIRLFPTTDVRHVHSKRQIKRLMAPFHPAYRRKARKNGLLKEPEELPGPKYPALGEPVLLSNGWSKPLVEDPADRPDYPFQIRRTKNKPMGAVGFLPVYSKHRCVCRRTPSNWRDRSSNLFSRRNDGTKVTTLVKGVTGDREAFENELRAVLQTHKPFKQRAMGTVLEVPGDNVARIKKWLTGLGF